MKSDRRKNARPPITELATIIEDDIKSRNLSSGDPYLGLTETARMLKTSNSGANSALQLLVKKGVLERKQRRGTFISRPPTGGQQVIRRVHLLLHEDFLKQEGVLTDGQVIGIQSELPRAEIQFNFLPQHDQRDYVQEIVNESLVTAGVDAFILYSTSLDAQRILVESGLPTAVVGSLYPSITGLPWIDQDQKLAGEMIFHNLHHEKKCEQFLVLMRERSYPGDYLFLDTLQQCFAKAGISSDRVIYRSLPSDISAIQAETKRVLSRFDSTTGVIARSLPLANGTRTSLEELGLVLNQNVFILVSNVFGKEREELKYYTYIRPTSSPKENGAYIGRVLRQFVTSGFKSNECWQVPVEIVNSTY
tara:strand:+ start:37998 stop:39086 length:1089 start_codon:yes stop_codon:yes gene_type:complete